MRGIWSHLDAFGGTWRLPEESGTSGAIRIQLEPPGAIDIWKDLEAPRRHPESTQKASRRHPGGTQKADRRHPEAPRRQPGHKRSL